MWLILCAMANRQTLWDQNRDVAMLALAHLLDDGEEELEEEPVIVVADEEDEVGSGISKALTELIDRHDDIEAIVVGNEGGATILIVPHRIVVAFMEAANAECAKLLEEEPPEDLMWSVVISDGGIMLLQVPIEPLRAIGSA